MPEGIKKEEKTETVKVTPLIKGALEAVKNVENHSTMDSVARTLLIYRSMYLKEHPEGLLLTEKD